MIALRLTDGESQMTEALPEEIDGAIIFDGLDEAIIGYGQQWGGEVIVVYDEQKIIASLVTDQGMGYEEARDWYYSNIICVGAGPRTPFILTVRHEGGLA